MYTYRPKFLQTTKLIFRSGMYRSYAKHHAAAGKVDLAEAATQMEHLYAYAAMSIQNKATDEFMDVLREIEGVTDIQTLKVVNDVFKSRFGMIPG